MLSLYNLLDTKARLWWYNRELRDKGNTEEARKRERTSIKDSIRVLRQALANGGYCQVGRNGWTIYCAAHSTLSHYGGLDAAMVQACIKVGIPVIDTLTIPDKDIAQTIKLPIIHLGKCDKPPYGSMSYAPLNHVLPLYRELGATIYNWEDAK